MLAFLLYLLFYQTKFFICRSFIFHFLVSCLSTSLPLCLFWFLEGWRLLLNSVDEDEWFGGMQFLKMKFRLAKQFCCGHIQSMIRSPCISLVSCLHCNSLKTSLNRGSKELLQITRRSLKKPSVCVERPRRSFWLLALKPLGEWTRGSNFFSGSFSL